MDEEWNRQGVLRSLPNVLQDSSAAAGKGKKQWDIWGPAPCPVHLFLTAWRSRAVIHWVRPHSSWPTPSSHVSCTITSHGSHRSSCDFSFTVVILLCVWILLFITQLQVFHSCAFYQELCISTCKFYFLEVGVFSITGWCCYINRNAWGKERCVSLSNIAHISVMHVLWVLTNGHPSDLFMSVSGIKCFSTDRQINCFFFLWNCFDTLANFLTSKGSTDDWECGQSKLPLEVT